MPLRLEQIKEISHYEQWAKQILYWRAHLDVFIEDYFKVKLKDTQKVIARAIGNGTVCDLVKSRGYGKTWLIALCVLALGVLYPGSLIAVVSGTAKQATLILEKIDTYFTQYPDIMREIKYAGQKPVVVTNDRGVCKLKNGSEIKSYSIVSMRGNRAKIVVVDEAPEVNKDDLDAIVGPVRNTKRDICHQHGIPDYTSKTISITSACLKSNFFYDHFMNVLGEMANGNQSYFACALDYQSAIRVGITDSDFFEEEKKRLPISVFNMEYGSMFVGAEANSIFPYTLTEACRNLKHVEFSQPKNSKSKYVIALDIATSGSKLADNAVFTVFKLTEKEDGTIFKRIVYIRTFHGMKLDFLAVETRKLYARFPNTIKVVFDHTGLGDAFPQFFRESWVDPLSGKEYPPWVCDEDGAFIVGSEPMLRAIKFTQGINQNAATALRVALEQRTISIPVSSRMVINGDIVDSVSEDGETYGAKKNREEIAIYIESDALQVEMGNIVARQTTSGSYSYDTAKPSQHKDRYSSAAMGVLYVSEMEEAARKKYQQRRSGGCVGVIYAFDYKDATQGLY